MELCQRQSKEQQQKCDNQIQKQNPGQKSQVV